MNKLSLSPFTALAALSLAACGGSIEDPLYRFSDAREAIEREALDPSSVKFRDLRFCGESNRIVTGEFNEKNRLGAYEGFKTFFYDTKSLLTYSPRAMFSNFSILSNGMTPFQIVAYEKLAPLCYVDSKPEFDFLYETLEEDELEAVEEMRAGIDKILSESAPLE